MLLHSFVPRPLWALAAPLAILLATLWSQAALAKPGAIRVQSADGVDLAVVEAGDRTKPAILFIHGFGQSHLSFRRQFSSALADRYHLVAFDLRGHGASGKPTNPAAYTDPARSADDVAAVIKATGLVRPVIVAWSYGGIVAGDYIRKYGTGAIAGLVLAGTLGGFTAASDPLPAELLSIARQMRAASQQSRSDDLADNIAAARITSAAYADHNSTPDDRAILLATELMLPAYARRALAMRPMDNRDLTAQLGKIPLLLVRGESELGMPEAGIADLQRQLPGLTIARFPGGHLTFFNHADRFNRMLSAFVDQAAISAGATGPAPAAPSFLPLTLAAHQAFRDREFMTVDRNGDGALDYAELEFRMLAAVGQSSPQALARAMRVNCGRIVPTCSRAAFRAQGNEEFRRVDSDHDGTVTAAEFDAAGRTFHTEQPF